MSGWRPINPQFVATSGVILTASFTRPSDTTAYAQYDAVCNSTSAPAGLVFAGAASVVGGSLYIVKAEIETNQAACTAQFRLYFFTQAVALTNDNAQYPTAYANAAYRIGFIDVPALQTEGTGSGSASAVWSGTPLHVVCGDASTSLYCPALVTRGTSGWTPASAQQFHIRLGVDRN